MIKEQFLGKEYYHLIKFIDDYKIKNSYYCLKKEAKDDC